MPRDDLDTEPALVDITAVPIADLLRMTDDRALAHALRRISREAAESEVPVASFDSAILRP